MCFVHSWNIGLAGMWRADWLSQNNKAGCLCSISKSFNKLINHTNSHVALAIDLYSASIEDLETVHCFFDFQEIKDAPMKIQKPVTDLLVSGHVAQFVSERLLIEEKMKLEGKGPALVSPLYTVKFYVQQTNEVALD